jgi:PQQ-dependent dehydrogenase (s-GDH family)
MTRAGACGVFLAAFGALVLAQNPRLQHNVGPEVFDTRVVTAGLENPWEVTWGPDDRLWITERTGFRVTRVNPADGSKKVALALDDVYQASVQDGLMGLAFHQEFLRGKGLDFAFVAYTYDKDPGPAVVRRMRISRFTYDSRLEALTAPTVVLDDMPAHDDHGGGRLAVGPDGKLYLTRGDQGSNWLANYCNTIHSQDLPTREQVQAHDWTNYQGKILRLNLDGSIPADNPVLGGVRSHVYTYGHRNPQGLAFGPAGLLYSSEHGPSTDDEVNLIASGKNYGWPRVAGFKDDQAYVWANWSASSVPCKTLSFNPLAIPPSVPQASETSWEHRDFVAPLATLFTVPAAYDLRASGNATIAPAGIDTYTSTVIPNWANSILVTGMRTGAVYRLKLSGDGRRVMGEPIEYFKANDRYRDIAISPDGRRIFLVTDSFGATADAQGQRTESLANPGALVEFTYTGRQATRGGAR